MVKSEDFLDWDAKSCSFKIVFDHIELGERNGQNKLHGKCIKIEKYGDILIKHYKKGRFAFSGNYVMIYAEGTFRVGEYFKDTFWGRLNIRKGIQYELDTNAEVKNRFRAYKTDGSVEEFGY